MFLTQVVPGSLADRAGLRNGDIVDVLEGLQNLDLKATDRLLVTSRDRIELVVHRNTGASSSTSAGQARIWKPEITHDTHINKFQHSTHHIPAEQPPQPHQAHNVRVSLEHSNTAQVPQGFNSTALPFNTDPRVKHAQYNSPLSLYSKQNAAEQYEMQTSELLNKMSLSGGAPRGVAVAQTGGAGAPSFRSETMRLIQEEAARGGAGRNSTLSAHPNPAGLPSCFVCTRPILGVMARAAGHEVHGDCLSCATCGASLKNVGHHFIDEKFYCDVHGSQRKALLSGSRPAAVSAAPAARTSEPPRAAYQPSLVMSQRPLSVSTNAPAAHHQTSTYSSTTTHLTNPKTAGPISPAHRGVPTNPPFTATSRPVSPPSYAPPPPPPTSAPPTGGSSFAQSTHDNVQRRTTNTTTSSTTNGYGSRPVNGGYTSPYTNGGSSYNNRNQVSSMVSSARMQQQQEPQPGERVPFCEACHGAIRGPFVLAGGKSWCPEHFICSNKTCGRKLLECGFVEENGQKFCETCFEKTIAPRCAKCSTAIVSDCLNALQKKWHPACFTCAHCQSPFGNAAFYLEQGQPYCEKDWNMLFTTKCVACRFPIEAGDRWVEALGSAYHSNCFSCTRCRVNLEGESFYAKNGEPYCKAHA
ncbi:hypothetical protein PFISCL1PPCAC_17324 [Pristionchus fissidentatus]|uniref:PDZ and LIM domain protein Zasp n=1 Tax=Pristionchus fissidentatus TaxID=1538716 RepID=A0AAV5W4U8_9BILA|nr:hypothetical protein PFISCL1PPCAC_17324 [Pristionchus fissidentatus]